MANPPPISLWSAVKDRLRAWFPSLSVSSRPIRLRFTTFVADILRKCIPVRCAWGPPKGFFSDYEQLTQGRAKGRVVLEFQPVPPVPPGALRTLARL